MFVVVEPNFEPLDGDFEPIVDVEYSELVVSPVESGNSERVVSPVESGYMVQCKNFVHHLEKSDIDQKHSMDCIHTGSSRDDNLKFFKKNFFLIP